tara:strand:- start:4126 stop:4356 length:231 start_codon:yes stop_codon:yes gene_type:complete
MASKDTRRLNPGIQANLLYVGVGTKVNPRLIPATAEASISVMETPSVETRDGYGANPTIAFALNSSGSLFWLSASA